MLQRPMSDLDLFEALEQLVDAASITRVIQSLQLVTATKAAHISQNWDDQPLAARWRNVAERLDSLDTEEL